MGLRLAAGIFLVALAQGRAMAQERNVDVSAGYAFLYERGVDGGDSLSVPAGWYASAGGYLNSWLGIVGEVSGHYKTLTEGVTDVKTSIHIFGAGPKLAWRRNPRVTPYLQALFGGDRSSASAAGFDVSFSGFAIQPSAGLEINNGSGSLGLRVEGARASLRLEGEWFKETDILGGCRHPPVDACRTARTAG